MPRITKADAARIKPCVLDYERRPRNKLPPAVKRFRPIIDIPSAPKTISVMIAGAPTGGDLVLPVTLNGTTEDVTITLPAATTDIVADFEAHSEITSGQIAVTSSSGGSDGLPSYEITIRGASGFSAHSMTFGTIGNGGASDMTGGSHLPYAILRRCGG